MNSLIYTAMLKQVDLLILLSRSKEEEYATLLDS